MCSQQMLPASGHPAAGHISFLRLMHSSFLSSLSMPAAAPIHYLCPRRARPGWLGCICRRISRRTPLLVGELTLFPFSRVRNRRPPPTPPRSPARRCAILTGAVAGYRWLRNWRISWLPNCLSIWPASRLLLKTKDNCKICPCPCRVVGCPISAERFFSERSRGPQEEKSKHGRLRPKEAIRGADKPSHRG